MGIFKTQKNEEKDNQNNITNILSYYADNSRNLWICKNCESENSIAYEKCDVCDYHR